MTMTINLFGLKGASLFINQIESLIKFNNSNYEPVIIDINTFEKNKYPLQNVGFKRKKGLLNSLKVSNTTTLNNNNKLAEIFKINNSDKSTSHNYHILYDYILKKLGITSELNILEIGIGTNNPSLVSTMGKDGTPGASLRSFRDYLPNSNIYGADIDNDILFKEDRIKTCQVDQLDINSFNNIKNNFGDIKYDLIIDDGLHSIGANLNTLLFALNNINKNGWIVIEDILILNNWNSINYILSQNSDLKIYIVRTDNGCLFCVNKIK